MAESRHWGWDNGYYEDHCGETSSGGVTCDLMGTPGFPAEDDPWWDEQAIRDPGRTTTAGMSEDVKHTYDREKARAVIASAGPVPVSSLTFAERDEAMVPDKFGYMKKTRAYTAEEIETDVRVCLAEWIAK